jgi:hypothetical protein
VNLHFHYTDQKGTRMFGRPYQTVTSLSKDLVRLLSQTAVSDIWFCTSLQKKVSMRDGYPRAERTQENAISLKSLWLDVDVKPGKPDKGYETFDDAEKAIEAFYKKLGLPIPSIMVKSGGGVHVYWVLDQALTREEWQPLADRLKAAVIQEGLKADAFVTSDAARLLRVPETTNYKDGQQRPVSLWREDGLDYPKAALEKPLAAFTPHAHSVRVIPFQLPHTFKGVKPSARLAGLHLERASDGLEREIILDTNAVTTGCPFLGEALRTGGKNYTEPMWDMTTLAAAFLPDGREQAHKMAKGHTGYTEESTDQKFDRRKAFVARGGGWPSCRAIQATGCKACATCPHLGKIKGPLNLGMLGAPPAVAGDLSDGQVGATVFDLARYKVSFSNIKHRRWLYGIDLVRGEITVQGAPGGAGKTSLAIGMAIAIATGKDLLNETVWGEVELKALYINAEDSRMEMQRRIWAFCRKHGVTEKELDRLYVAGTDDPEVQALSFLVTTDRNLSVLNRAGFNRLEELLAGLQPDLVVIDPLIALCGGGNINDNAAMSLVMRELKRLATKFDCVIQIVHHTRKGAEAGSAEAISGAAAIVNLARRAIMPVTMTEDETAKNGVWPSERYAYFKVVDAKSNLAPRSNHTPWYRLNDIELPNPEPPTYRFGDGVQAVERVFLPLPNNGLGADEKQKIRRAIIDTVAQGKRSTGSVIRTAPTLRAPRTSGHCLRTR